jgi:flavin reductase (DIM6/NTAB) family NADH-FMN oxidoreductase RutF
MADDGAGSIVTARRRAPGRAPVQPAAFRTLMRGLAASVCVIAVGAPGARRGLTATSVAPLTDDPPTMLVCVNRTASAHDAIAAERCFAISVLAADQAEVAMRFSGQAGLRGEERFAGHPWRQLATGAPVLDGAAIVLDCELSEQKAVATHTIFLGRVIAGTSRDGIDPLLYLRGAYRTIGG